MASSGTDGDNYILDGQGGMQLHLDRAQPFFKFSKLSTKRLLNFIVYDRELIPQRKSSWVKATTFGRCFGDMIMQQHALALGYSQLFNGRNVICRLE